MGDDDSLGADDDNNHVCSTAGSSGAIFLIGRALQSRSSISYSQVVGEAGTSVEAG